ncbi:MAG TPA: cytochrome b N-terminal domain-containing protein [Vicinamibacterales bacterium]
MRVLKRMSALAAQSAAWLDSRTGYRALLDSALQEPLPRGTGWFFTTGSILTLLVGVQFVTGVALTMYYVPSPALAHDSVRFIMTALPLGSLLRGLHFWGASFLLVAAVVHMVRVFTFGSYKAPRELTWISGVLMLLVILGFALSGYLLPWDQKAYWATTVTINIARSTPIAGDVLASILRGGSDLGALTLGRWFSAHVFLLPMTLVTLTAAHIALMRKHGISGPLKPEPGPGREFFPWHVARDTVMMAAVFASLFAVAMLIPAPLDDVANPADSSYIPRPEWYFLSLFQLLKYFPGPLEPIGTQVIPGLVVGFLLLLPFIDRGAERHPLRGSRRWVTAALVTLGGGVMLLTALGIADRPARVEVPRGVRDLAIATFDESCSKCHFLAGKGGGIGPELTHVGRRLDEAAVRRQIEDAPAVNPESDMPAFKGKLSSDQIDALAQYLASLK